MTSLKWQEKAAIKQRSCLEKIPKEWILSSAVTSTLHTPLAEHANHVIEMNIPQKSGILSKKELDITENYTVERLLQALKDRTLSALEVTIAFSKRAAIAQQLLSCLTETYFPEAQARARFLDKEISQGRTVGPLHGLPVSLKDGFQIAGSTASLGFVSFLDRVSEKNSPLVEILLELGAVLYVKTNIPQTLMTADSHNNVFGRTLNPHKTCLTAGGSSGGEGSLIAFRGSPLGIGTDVAGSIRIPALCCGTYGFKPSASRIPYGGQASPSRPGMSFFLAAAGPLANDLTALSILYSAVLSTRPALYDSTALDIPWRPVPSSPKSPKLRLGIVSEDPAFPLHPPVSRALVDATEILKAQGHELVLIPASRAHVADATVLAFAYFGLDTTSMKHIEASGEPIVPSLKKTKDASSNFKSNFLADCAGLVGVERLAVLNVKRAKIADEWRAIWKEEKLNGVISAPSQGGAVAHDTFGLPPYTTFLNVLDYPACVIPFGKASKILDPDPLVVMGEQSRPNYEPAVVDGAPMSIQVFTNKLRDEECLQVAAVVDQALRKRL